MKSSYLQLQFFLLGSRNCAAFMLLNTMHLYDNFEGVAWRHYLCKRHTAHHFR